MVKAGFAPEKVRSVEMEAWFAVDDYKRWATIAWSYLGRPVGGRTVKDEEEWDKAVDMVVEGLKGGKWYIEGEDGIGKIKYVGTAVIAEK